MTKSAPFGPGITTLAGEFVDRSCYSEYVPHRESIRLDKLPGPQTQPEDVNVVALLNYKGPSSRVAPPIDEGMTYGSLAGSDSNCRKVDILFSAAQIPFFMHIERPTFDTPSGRLRVVVPRDRYRDAFNILTAAVEAGELRRPLYLPDENLEELRKQIKRD